MEESEPLTTPNPSPSWNEGQGEDIARIIEEGAEAGSATQLTSHALIDLIREPNHRRLSRIPGKYPDENIP